MGYSFTNIDKYEVDLAGLTDWTIYLQYSNFHNVADTDSSSVITFHDGSLNDNNNIRFLLTSTQLKAAVKVGGVTTKTTLQTHSGVLVKENFLIQSYAGVISVMLDDGAMHEIATVIPYTRIRFGSKSFGPQYGNKGYNRISVWSRGIADDIANIVVRDINPLQMPEFLEYLYFTQDPLSARLFQTGIQAYYKYTKTVQTAPLSTSNSTLASHTPLTPPFQSYIGLTKTRLVPELLPPYVKGMTTVINLNEVPSVIYGLLYSLILEDELEFAESLTLDIALIQSLYQALELAEVPVWEIFTTRILTESLSLVDDLIEAVQNIITLMLRDTFALDEKRATADNGLSELLELKQLIDTNLKYKVATDQLSLTQTINHNQLLKELRQYINFVEAMFVSTVEQDYEGYAEMLSLIEQFSVTLDTIQVIVETMTIAENIVGLMRRNGYYVTNDGGRSAYV